MGAAVNALPGGEIVPAMDRGLLDAAEFNNMSSDKLLGFPDVSKVCMLQSFHQNAEQFEITFNKTKYDALPEKLRAVISNAVSAASQELTWKAIDRYSKDYVELQTKDKVRFYKTPDAILQQQLDLYDTIVVKKSSDNPIFKEIIDSQTSLRRARGEMGHGQQRQPADGVQPLLRYQDARRRRRPEKGRGRDDTIREPPDGVFFAGAVVGSGSAPGCRARCLRRGTPCRSCCCSSTR